jgi:DNA-binding NtrC family response regulator/tetratricopeptide (TPR) repeat protein
MDAFDGREGSVSPQRSAGGRRTHDGPAVPTGYAQALAVGDMRMAADDFQSALDSYERALTLLGEDPDWRRERAEARLRIVECHRKRGEFQEALAELARIRQGIDPTIDADLGAKITGRTGMVQTSLGHYLIAQANCTKAYEALRSGNDNEEIGLLELTLGQICHRLGQRDRASEFFESALFTFRRIDHREGLARALNNLGLLLKAGPRWREALDYLQRALAISEEAGNAPRIASHCLNLGVLHTKLCAWDRALQTLSRALLTFREIKNHSGTAKTYLALGNLKVRLGQTTLAASHYEEALDLARRHGYKREEVLALEFLGEMALREERVTEARGLLAEALQKAEKIAPEGDLVCEVKHRLALEAMARGDLVAATRRATEAAWIADRIGDHCELGSNLCLLGEAAWEAGRPEVAIRLLRRSTRELAGTPDVLRETVSRIRLASVLVEDANHPGHDGSASAQQAIESLETLWERIPRLDLVSLAPGFVETHARALVAGGDLEGALRILDRGLTFLESQGRADSSARLKALKVELAENQAELVLSTSEEFQILQEFTPIEAGSNGAGGAQRLLLQMTSRLRVDRALVAVGGNFERLRVEGSIGCDRPTGMLRALEPVLHAFAGGRRVWLSRNSTTSLSQGLVGDPWRQEGPLVVLRLRPTEDLWGILVAERKGSEAFGTRDLRLLSLFGSLICVAIEEHRHATIEAGEAEGVATAASPFSDFLTVDPLTKETLALLQRVSDSDSSILLTGETGTGKGLIAQCIHRASRRGDHPLIQINCAALPEQLLESELFGHVQGAFTGAVRNKRGLIEEAEGGTLFLDEVDRCHRNVQAKLLHLLDRREFRPVGGVKPRTADVRFICATNTDLAAAIRRGDFLEDLFYRLNDFQFAIPPLRERREDIPLLVRRFLARFTQEMDRKPAGISREALRVLMDHEWRGNVRELEKCVRRLVVLCEDGGWIGVDLLPREMREIDGIQRGPATLKDAVVRLETDLIRRTLEETAGNKSETSRRLRLSYPALLEKIKRYRLEGPAIRKNSNRAS